MPLPFYLFFKLDLDCDILLVAMDAGAGTVDLAISQPLRPRFVLVWAVCVQKLNQLVVQRRVDEILQWAPQSPSGLRQDERSPSLRSL